LCGDARAAAAAAAPVTAHESKAVGKLSVCAMCKDSISHSLVEPNDPDDDPSTISFAMVKGRFPVRTPHSSILLHSFHC
jgi:hypothetical protein